MSREERPLPSVRLGVNGWRFSIRPSPAAPYVATQSPAATSLQFDRELAVLRSTSEADTW